MTVGIEIYGSSGIAQITSETINFFYAGKQVYGPQSDQSISAQFELPSWAYSTGTVRVMVATVSAAGVARLTTSYSSAYFGAGRPGAIVSGIRVDKNENTTLYYFVSFSQGMSSGAGIEIYSSTGATAYTSAQRPMKIIDVLGTPDFTYAAAYTNNGLLVASGTYAGSTVAVVNLSPTDKYRFTGGVWGTDTDGTTSITGYYRYSYAASIAGSTVNVKIFRFINLSEAESQGKGYPVLVVDVTGL